MRNPMISMISDRYLKDKYILVENMNYCVYFITDGEFVKIGVAASLPNRIKQLQTGNPRKLSAMYVIDAGTQKEALKVEANLHKIFSDKQCIGEWFNITENDVKKTCKKMGYSSMIPSSRFDFEVDGIRIV